MQRRGKSETVAKNVRVRLHRLLAFGLFNFFIFSASNTFPYSYYEVVKMKSCDLLTYAAVGIFVSIFALINLNVYIKVDRDFVIYLKYNIYTL